MVMYTAEAVSPVPSSSAGRDVRVAGAHRGRCGGALLHLALQLLHLCLERRDGVG